VRTSVPVITQHGRTQEVPASGLRLHPGPLEQGSQIPSAQSWISPALRLSGKKNDQCIPSKSLHDLAPNPARLPVEMLLPCAPAGIPIERPDSPRGTVRP